MVGAQIKITKIGEINSPADYENTLDANGSIIAPGFIDVHIHGASGADILEDSSVQALEAISQTIARFGVTGFLATNVFKPGEDNNHLSLAAEYTEKYLGGANLLGIHLEGPFISPEKRGMIQFDSMCLPSEKVLDDILKVTNGKLRMMTIAPELPGNLQIIKKLVSLKIIAAFAHSAANYEQTIESFKAGISHVTHLFNAMLPIHHRLPGPIVAILENKNITAQIISDGVHVHSSVLRLVYEILGVDRTILITDAVAAMGLDDGKYYYNSVEYEIKDGSARYNDGTLLGTAIGLNMLLQRFITFTGSPFETAIKTVTENPAKLLGIDDRKGFIAVGKDADLVLLGDQCDVQKTIVGGKIVFSK